jgi:iron complex outermembrane recepter protein
MTVKNERVLGIAATTIAALLSQFANAQDSLEAIVVTAEKRPEWLQNVPIAITAITADAMRARGVTNSSDLASVVPGLDMSQQLFNATPFLRGIGSPNSTIGEEPAVAVYVDGVYRPSLPGAIFNFANVERVEVLSGPQGTLFGRNAVGGVINVITKDPDQAPSADIGAGYGNYETVNGSFYGTSGITDNLKADLSAYALNQGKGFMTNVFNGQLVGKERDLNFRSKWVLTIDSNTQAKLSLDYDDHTTATGINMGPIGASRLADGKQSFGFYTTDSNYPPLGRTEQWGGGLTVTHDFGWANFVSISSDRHLTSHLSVDQDQTPIPLVNVAYSAPEITYTQEFQIISPQDSKIKWIGGLYYFNDKAAYAPLYLSGIAFLPLPYLDKYGQEKTQSYAAFGQATGNLGFDTNLTLGYRFTDDRRSVFGYNFTDPVVLPPNGIFPGTTGSGTATFRKSTYRISLDHDFSNDFMTYISYNRGFKGGLFNTQAPLLPAVKPETLDAFEVGEKAQFFNRHLQLNSSAFYYKFTDIQAQSISAGVVYLLNAASAHVKGFEAEAEWIPIDRLDIQATASYLDATYTSFPNAPTNTPRPNGVTDATGNTLPHAPRWTFNTGLQYTIPSSSGSYRLGTEVSYNNGFYWDPDNVIRQPSYTLVNASVLWKSLDGKYDLSVWGKNLAGAKYYVYATSQALGETGAPAFPRTFGFTVGLHLK